MLSLQDLPIDLDEVTELESDQIFHMEPQNVRPEERYEALIASFSFGVDLDQTVVQRMGYTFLDVLSDIGGIQSIVASTLVIFLTILNYNNLDNHLIARFYKQKALTKTSKNKVNS